MSDSLPNSANGAFNQSAPTLEDLMLKGDAKDTWVNTCEKVGELMATERKKFIANNNIFLNGSKGDLGEWIEKVGKSWDNLIRSFAPASRVNYLDLDRIRERGQQVADLLRWGKFVNYDYLVTKYVQMPTDEHDVQINFGPINLVNGPLGLDAAVFLADVLVKYYQQLTLEHTIRYVTSDCAKSFGRAFDTKMEFSEAESKNFWAETSLLTGWEIIRRVTEDKELQEWSQRNGTDLVDVFEAGLRLVYNKNIENINFMIVVALAEI